MTVVDRIVFAYFALMCLTSAGVIVRERRRYRTPRRTLTQPAARVTVVPRDRAFDWSVDGYLGEADA